MYDCMNYYFLVSTFKCASEITLIIQVYFLTASHLMLKVLLIESMTTHQLLYNLASMKCPHHYENCVVIHV